MSAGNIGSDSGRRGADSSTGFTGYLSRVCTIRIYIGYEGIYRSGFKTECCIRKSKGLSQNHQKQMIERQPLTFSGEDTESKRFVMIKTFESERGKEYTSSRGLKKNNGERGFRQMYCCLKKCK